MTETINRQWLLVSRPEEGVREQDFRWVEVPIPALKPGEFRIRTLWLSFDPTQFGWMSIDTYVPKIPLGEVMRAIGVGQVVESQHSHYRVGELVTGLLGWQDYLVTDGQGLTPLRKLPTGVPPNLALSLFGITGMSAYFGTIEIGKVKAGETFVVSSAAGAVGSVAGQIAKIRGARVIGIAGGRAKCDWILQEAGFDGAIDYRSEPIGARLSALCPEGIDVYFDNVGGEILDEVLARITLHARIVLCGAISGYTTRSFWPLKNYYQLTPKRARMEGFIILDYASRFPEAAPVLAEWMAQGRLKQKEDIATGLENAPKTLARLFTGQNFGKQLLRVAEPAAV
jgi:NADPH-dependent curcumin reductase